MNHLYHNRTNDNEARKTSKRVAFDVEDPSSEVGGEDKENHLLRRGTPHQSKRFKEMSSQQVMDLVADMPPPDFEDDDNGAAADEDHEDGTEPFAEDNPVEEETLAADGNNKGGEEEGNNEDDDDDDDDGEDELQEPSEQDKLWDALREEKLEQGDEVMECFVQGQERYKSAEEKISDSLKTFHDQMEAASNRAVQQLVLPIYNVEREKIHGVAADCKRLLMQNQDKRAKFFKDLDAAEKQISRGIRALKARTLDIEDPEDSEASPNSKTGGSPASGMDGSNEEVNEELLWNEILSDVNQGRVDTASLFLSAQQRLEEADARFEDAIGRIQGDWKANTDSVIELVKEIHRVQQQEIESLDDFLRFEIVKTDGRQKEFASKLEEAERNHQAFYSTLIGKVTSKFLGFRRSSKTTKK